MAPPLLGAAQRPNSMRPQAWGYTFAPQDRPKARIAPPLLGAAQRPNSMRPQAWGSFNEPLPSRTAVFPRPPGAVGRPADQPRHAGCADRERGAPLPCGVSVGPEGGGDSKRGLEAAAAWRDPARPAGAIRRAL